MTKPQPAAWPAKPRCVLSFRTRGNNPNHHLWFNSRARHSRSETGCSATNRHGSWWMHYTVHLPDATKHRVRRSLRTRHVEIARSRRDAILEEFGPARKEAA